MKYTLHRCKTRLCQHGAVSAERPLCGEDIAYTELVHFSDGRIQAWPFCLKHYPRGVVGLIVGCWKLKAVRE